MNLKTVGLATAGLGAAVAFGLLKWKVLSGKTAWWAIGIGALLFLVGTPAQGEGGNR